MSWFASETSRPVLDDLLYPAQAVDGLVHAEGQGKLRAALATLPVLEERANGEHVRCRVGEAVVTPGTFHELPFDAIVHTVPPFWPSPADGEQARAVWAAELLRCYEASFRAAFEFAASCDRSASAAGLAVATPVLGSGARGAPMAPAARILAQAAALSLCEASAASAGLSLRVVMNPATFESDVEAVAAVVHDAVMDAVRQAGAGG